MKPLRITFLVFPLVLSVTTAWAQFGMYGAPELLSMPRTNQAMVPYGVYTAPSASAVVPATAPFAAPVQAAVANRYASMPAEPAPPQGPSSEAASDSGSVGLLLNESNCEEPRYCGEPACTDGLGCGGEMACVGGCGEPSCCPWYGLVTALVMGRNHGNKLWTSYQANDVSNQLVNSQDIELGWTWGGEVRFGRRFCCNQWAVEAAYWTLDPFDGAVSCFNPNFVSSPLITSDIEFGGVAGDTYFDGATEHRLWRRDELQNIELNLIRNRMLGACGQPCAVDWLMGVRYFRFKEHFVFGSRKGATWGANGGTNEAYLSDRITNDLIGFQMGCDASYHAGCSLRLFASPKFGIYHNRIDNFFQAYRGDGVVANPTAGSGRPEAFPVSSAKNVVSFMGQIDVGAEWQFANNWSARIGYRLVAVTDVGLADEQIPVYVVDIPEIASIDHNSNLILHGAFVGLTYNY